MSLLQRFRFAAIAALTLAAVATVAIACGSRGGSDEGAPAASTTASFDRFLALPAGAYGITQEQYEAPSDQQRAAFESSTQLGQLDFSVNGPAGAAGLPGRPGLAGSGSFAGATATHAAA